MVFITRLKRFFQRFRRQKPKHDIPKERAYANPELLRETLFLRKELLHQSNYVPELARISAKVLKNPDFYEKTRVLKITGKLGLDTEIMGNVRNMETLIGQINHLRIQARRTRSHKETDRLIDEARELEKQFNDLKAENLKIFMAHFKKGKKSNGK